MKQYFLVIGLYAGAIHAGQPIRLEPAEVYDIFIRAWHECTTLKMIIDDRNIVHGKKVHKVERLAKTLLEDIHYLSDNLKCNADTTVTGYSIDCLNITIKNYLEWANSGGFSEPKPVILAEDSDPEDDDAEDPEEEDDDNDPSRS